jgi:hypothetical protein
MGIAQLQSMVAAQEKEVIEIKAEQYVPNIKKRD